MIHLVKRIPRVQVEEIEFLIPDILQELKFERADTLNRTDWFEQANEKYGECMKAHAEGVGSVFGMSNYWNWYNEKRDNK